MNKLSWFIAGLCLVVLAAFPVFAQTESDSPYEMTNGRPQDFVEFEELASGPMPWVRDRTFVPDYRAMSIAQAKRFEAFLDKYPASPLKPEALLRLAIFYLGVEGQDIHMLRQQLFFCQGIALEQRSQQKADLCQQRFMLSVASSGSPMDQNYLFLGQQILERLSKEYPRARRYVMVGGKFRFDEEEIGGIALYILAMGVMPKDKILHYETIILEEYQIRPELRRDIQNRLEH